MIQKILSTIFPPKLSGSLPRHRELIFRVGLIEDDPGAVLGKAQPKKYRDGIERYFAENN